MLVIVTTRVGKEEKVLVELGSQGRVGVMNGIRIRTTVNPVTVGTRTTRVMLVTGEEVVVSVTISNNRTPLLCQDWPWTTRRIMIPTRVICRSG